MKTNLIKEFMNSVLEEPQHQRNPLGFINHNGIAQETRFVTTL
jgi:hypothetical protein